MKISWHENIIKEYQKSWTFSHAITGFSQILLLSGDTAMSALSKVKVHNAISPRIKSLEEEDGDNCVGSNTSWNKNILRKRKTDKVVDKKA